MGMSSRSWNLLSRSKSRPMPEELECLSLSSYCSKRDLETFALDLVRPIEGSTVCLPWAFPCSGSIFCLWQSCDSQPRHDGFGSFFIVYSSYFNAAFLMSFPEIQEYTMTEIKWKSPCCNLGKKLLCLKKDLLEKVSILGHFSNNKSLAL